MKRVEVEEELKQRMFIYILCAGSLPCLIAMLITLSMMMISGRMNKNLFVGNYTIISVIVFTLVSPSLKETLKAEYWTLPNEYRMKWPWEFYKLSDQSKIGTVIIAEAWLLMCLILSIGWTLMSTMSSTELLTVILASLVILGAGKTCLFISKSLTNQTANLRVLRKAL